jgi:hypothetical protein
MRPARALLLPALVLLLPAAQAAGVVVLIHHPTDHVDPFGVPLGRGDSFSARYGHLAAATGRFDYPTFVADGVLPVPSLPDPDEPYASTLSAYANATAARLARDPPAALRLEAREEGSEAAVDATALPRGPVADPGGAQRIHLWVALAEDAIHYEPPAPVSNGVTDHRFTVRAIRDLGPVDLSAGEPASASARFPLAPSWDRSRLFAAAWLQADAAPGRFEAHEVLQAASLPLGAPAATQQARAVLVEVYSATWCGPCLYGDLAAERLAVLHGAATELEPRRQSHFPGVGWLPAALAAAAGLTAAAWPARRQA